MEDGIRGGFPLTLKKLEQYGDELHDELYAANALVLVRPDGITADCWQDASVANGEETARLTSCLPNT